MIRRCRLLALLIVVALRADGLRAQDSVVRLTRRSFIPPRGIDSALVGIVRSPRASPLHVLVQFSRPITERDRAALTAVLDVRAFRPVSSTLVFATIPARVVLRGALPEAVRWIGTLRPGDKTSLILGPPRPPPAATADSGRRVPLVVQFFPDVVTADQRSALARHGADRFGRVDVVNGWMITLDRDSITSLATEDGVLWIEGPPVARQFDNDFARSRTGVNSDAVTLSTPYGLTGAGTVLGYWDQVIPSVKHVDFGGRVIDSDPITWWSRNVTFVDGNANGQFDNGETLFIDMDDSQKVSVNDQLINGSSLGIVNAGYFLIGTVLHLFDADTRHERYVDVNGSGIYSPGEPIYRDVDADKKVSAGDIVLLGPAQAAGTQLLRMTQDKYHWHPTMVVGSILGSGSNSAAAPFLGTANQWKGIAPSAKLNAYTFCRTPAVCYSINPTSEIQLWTDEFSAALTASVGLGAVGLIHPWGPGGCNGQWPPANCYTTTSRIYDGIASGRDEFGNATGYAKRVLTVGSAGNTGWPERHTDERAPSGSFQGGESIYRDNDGNFKVSSDDDLLLGPGLPDGTSLVDFLPAEMHVAQDADGGSFLPSEDIYSDVDGSGTVTALDVRIVTTLFGFTNGSTVQAGDPDEVSHLALRRFVFWGNVQMYNGAKNTLQVGGVGSDATLLASFSSRGPTSDGRIKPDLVAPATSIAGYYGIKSTWPRNGYDVRSGTSMSTGFAAGSLALLTEWHRTACGLAGPAPETARALFLHGAEDVVSPDPLTNPGANVGPDYVSGFGRLRVPEAVDLVAHHVTSSITTAAPRFSLPITIARTHGLKVTLAWSDLPGLTAIGPGPHGILQNDLDLLLIAPDGTQYGPWVLDPLKPGEAARRFTAAGGAPAPTGDNLNTIEQVVVDDAAAGTWTIVVSASQLNLGPQEFTLVSEAISPASSPCATTPAADVWVRDNDTDVGTTPSTGMMYLGPDLWNRTLADALPDHQNPEYGQANYLYVNVRNRSAVTARATTVELWLGDAATGLIWPSSYTYVGRIVVPNLAPGEVRTVGPLAWTPPGPGHYCMYMRLLSPQDPIGITETANIWTNASGSNNIAYRNLNVVDLHSSRSVSFLVRNTDPQATTVDLTIRVPQGFLQSGTVALRMGRVLAGWTPLDSRPPGLVADSVSGARVLAPTGEQTVPGYLIKSTEVTILGIPVRPGRTERMILTFASTRQDTTRFDVDVIQRIRGELAGGIRYVVRTGYR